MAKDLIPGELYDGNFKASIAYIQTPAIHTISFKLKNNLPIKTQDFDSNILVKFPEVLTISKENNDVISGKETDPVIKGLDGYMKIRPENITRYKEKSAGCDVRPCYLIRHSNFIEVPKGSLI